MKYYLIAGEASGDLHGSNLMKTIKEEDANADFRFLGGDLMLKHSPNICKHYKDMAYMGFVEVVLNISTILSNMSICKKDILAYKPDVLILIDFPGFNMKMASFAKKHNIKVCYYISPKVWAWNQKRVLNIKKVVDKMFCILPFEVDFYKSWGMEVEYVGNPLFDAISEYVFNDDFLVANNLSDKKIIALLPGSRKQEIDNLLPNMLNQIDNFPDYQFVIAGAPSFGKEYYSKYLQGRNIPIVFNQTYDLLNNSEAAIVASGTATLETTLLNVPQVVVYAGNSISMAIAKMVIKVKYISLVNLIAEKEVVKELIQSNYNNLSVKAELNNLLNSEYREKMLNEYSLIINKMGTVGASAKTARHIVKYLKNS